MTYAPSDNTHAPSGMICARFKISHARSLMKYAPSVVKFARVLMIYARASVNYARLFVKYAPSIVNHARVPMKHARTYVNLAPSANTFARAFRIPTRLKISNNLLKNNNLTDKPSFSSFLGTFTQIPLYLIRGGGFSTPVFLVLF
jgi:hypothetical protein